MCTPRVEALLLRGPHMQYRGAVRGFAAGALERVDSAARGHCHGHLCQQICRPKHRWTQYCLAVVATAAV